MEVPSYLYSQNDRDGTPSVITLCNQHLAANSPSVLWIEEFGARWQEQRRTGLCLDCARSMKLEGAT